VRMGFPDDCLNHLKRRDWPRRRCGGLMPCPRRTWRLARLQSDLYERCASLYEFGDRITGSALILHFEPCAGAEHRDWIAPGAVKIGPAARTRSRPSPPEGGRSGPPVSRTVVSP